MKTRLGRGVAVGTICAAALLFSSAVRAQNARETAQIVKSMPSEAQQVVQRLGELDHLPAGEWRFHAGDVPHGESTSLDDSSWQTVKPGFTSSGDSAWFRRWVEVPKTLNGYDLTGTRIWFRFMAYANGPMPQIIYFNGSRVALGDDLEPIVLLDNAKPGEKVLIAVKLMQTVDQKRFHDAEFKIDFAENRPNPDDLRKEFLSATLLVPSLSKNQQADETTLEKSIQTVDLKALDAADQTKFDASLKQATSELEALKPLLQQGTFHLTGNSHIDAAWLWPWTETVDVVKRTFSTALQLMNEYPNYTYTQSAAAYNYWMATKYPAINDEIKKRIKEGRWEVVGGMWVEPDLNMPSGEATARSILLGKRFYQQEYGVDVRIGWNPDSFGYNWQLPQIYKKSGIDYFVTQKMAWNDTNQLPFKLFWWESPDGSKVLTYFPHDYANNNLNPVRLSADLASARKFSPGMTEMMDLYGIGDHGGGPTRAVLDEGDHWSQPDKIVPNYKFGTAQSFFSTVEKEIAPESPTWDYFSIMNGYKEPPTPPEGQIAIPTWKTEMYFEYHRGVMTTQAHHKWNMRHSEMWALNAEKYASLAWLDGKSYPNSQLTDAWRTITFNDFHDLAAGSGIGIIYKEAQEQFDKTHLETDKISQDSLKTISARINTASAVKGANEVPVLVFNPLAWERTGWAEVSVQMPNAAPNGVSVLDPAGHVLPSVQLSKDEKTNSFRLLVDAKNVPSMGYEVLHVVPGDKPFTSDLKVNGLTLENADLRVTVDKTTGCITSLFDKKSNFETLAQGACGNELQAFKDTPKDYDAWNIDPGTLDVPPTKLTDADSVELVEKGPARASIKITRHWSKSKFVQEIQLAANSDEVNVVNDIDWHEDHILLKAAFPLAVKSDKATYEIPYGSIERPTTRNNSWDKAQFEVPALRWADLSDNQHGFSLINNSKYGYDDAGSVLRLSLLRSPKWPDPDADRGHQHFTFALYPHAGDWREALTVRHGYEYNYSLKAVQVEAHTGTLPLEHSFLTVKPENVVLTAMKKAEDTNSLILHMYEWAGKQANVEISVPPGATAATETNLMEKPEGSPLAVAGDHVTVPIHPYEILAVRVDYPHGN